jgi:DNA-directed RNA polymerase subunit H (RpoH/RPB5)
MTIFSLDKMSLNLEYVSRIGRVKKCSCIMMNDRGYELPDQENQLETMSDLSVGALYLSLAKKVKCSLGYALSCTYVRNNESALVLFVDNNYDEGKRREKMVSTDQAKAALNLWKNSFGDCKKCILICPGKLSPDAKKEVSLPNVTILTHEFLLMPVGRHVLVPNHYPLNENDSDIFLKSRKIERDQLPQLKVSDPISCYYGFEPNTIVKISRPGWSVYRVVVS